jgi:hypothetical protein
MYPVESKSLQTWMVKRLYLFGVFCVKVAISLKETIISSTDFSKVRKIWKMSCLEFHAGHV